MATAYKNAGAAAGTSWTDVYTCPASTEAVVTHIQLANVDGASTVTGVGVRWTDSSDTDQPWVLLQDAEIPVGQSIPALGDSGTLHLEAGDKVQVIAGAASDVEATVTVAEITA